jgi:hypothetical protein
MLISTLTLPGVENVSCLTMSSSHDAAAASDPL